LETARIGSSLVEDSQVERGELCGIADDVDPAEFLIRNCETKYAEPATSWRHNNPDPTVPLTITVRARGRAPILSQ